MAALAGAILRTGGLDPAFALARILPFATVLRALAGTLTLAAIRSDTFHAGLILLAAEPVCFVRRQALSRPVPFLREGSDFLR